MLYLKSDRFGGTLDCFLLEAESSPVLPSDVPHYTFWSLKQEHVLSSCSWPSEGRPFCLYLLPRALPATAMARPFAAPSRLRTGPAPARLAAAPAWLPTGGSQPRRVPCRGGPCRRGESQRVPFTAEHMLWEWSRKSPGESGWARGVSQIAGLERGVFLGRK